MNIFGETTMNSAKPPIGVTVEKISEWLMLNTVAYMHNPLSIAEKTVVRDTLTAIAAMDMYTNPQVSIDPTEQTIQAEGQNFTRGDASPGNDEGLSESSMGSPMADKLATSPANPYCIHGNYIKNGQCDECEEDRFYEDKPCEISLMQCIKEFLADYNATSLDETRTMNLQHHAKNMLMAMTSLPEPVSVSLEKCAKAQCYAHQTSLDSECLPECGTGETCRDWRLFEDSTKAVLDAAGISYDN